MIRDNTIFNDKHVMSEDDEKRLTELKNKLRNTVSFTKSTSDNEKMNKSVITKPFAESKIKKFEKVVDNNTKKNEKVVDNDDSSSSSEDLEEKKFTFPNLESKDIRHNLSIIRDLKKGQKLCFSVEGKRLDIESSWVPSLSRRLRDIGRNKIIKFIEHNTQGAFAIMDCIVTNKIPPNLSDIDKITYDNGQLLNDIKDKLRDSMTGLEEMKKTYKGDSNTVTEIDSLIKSINQKISNVNQNTEYRS